MSDNIFKAPSDVLNWTAVFKCMDEYRKKYPGEKRGHDYEHNPDHYNDYMKDAWGIDHTNTYIRIIDQQKYLMLLLKFA